MVLKLETGKTYVDGYNQKVRIVCTDRKRMDGYSCIGLTESADQAHEYIGYYKPDGHMNGTCADLIHEYEPLSDLPIDTPVWVRDSEDCKWKPRHYAGPTTDQALLEQGYRFKTWFSKGTSHTTNQTFNWKYMTDKSPVKEQEQASEPA